eukprot:5355731-Ditylum_brightwellii.AAC.1
MGMGMVLARAQKLNNDIVRQTGETMRTNYNEAIPAFKQVIPHLNKIAEQREKVIKLLNIEVMEIWCGVIYLPFIVNKKEDIYDHSMFNTSQHFSATSSTATSPAFEEEIGVYDAFKESTHSNDIDMTEYKYMLGKALESQLM